MTSRTDELATISLLGGGDSAIAFFHGIPNYHRRWLYGTVRLHRQAGNLKAGDPKSAIVVQ